MYNWKKIKLPNQKISKELITYKIDNITFYSLANKFLMLRKGRSVSVDTTDSNYIHTIVHFLDYLCKKENYFFDLRPELLTFDMAQDYLDYYCTTKTFRGDEPCEAARIRTKKHLTHFLLNLKSANICPDLKEHEVAYYEHSDFTGNIIITSYELSHYTAVNQPKVVVLRYCPDYFIDELFDQAAKNDPDLYMLMALQRYAGLRPSEACNVRTQDSSYGAGYKISYKLDGESGIYEAHSLSFDIKKKPYIRPLRTDDVYVGGIKRPREVDVYPGYVPVLSSIINDYVLFSSRRKREYTGPLVTTPTRKNGYNMAITYDSYRIKFNNLVEEYVIPSLINQGGLKALYAKKLKESYYGPHMLREFFTCELVRNNLGWSELMHYRGDKGESSAVIYVLKGGVLNDSISYTEQVISKDIMSYAEKEKILKETSLKDSLAEKYEEYQTLPFRI